MKKILFVLLLICVCFIGCKTNKQYFKFNDEITISIDCAKDWSAVYDEKSFSIAFCKDKDSLKSGEWFAFLNFGKIEKELTFDEYEKEFFNSYSMEITKANDYIRIYRLKKPWDTGNISAAMYLNEKQKCVFYCRFQSNITDETIAKLLNSVEIL